MLVYTIGHSTRTTEAFVELLDEFGVKHLVDVRRYPGSRRNPHFSRDVLQKNLKELGIDYTHMEALGGRRRPNPDSPNTHWTSDGFRGYADYTATASFDAGLTELVRIANRQTGGAGEPDAGSVAQPTHGGAQPAPGPAEPEIDASALAPVHAPRPAPANREALAALPCPGSSCRRSARP